MRMLNILSKSSNQNIYDPNLNYKLFNSYSNELSKKLLDLIKNKNKSSFEELVIFMFENPDAFKIIDFYYPYNNIELREGELKFSNYYIYLWHHLYSKNYNFSVRINNERYNVVFPDSNQSERITPYFILNEDKSLILSLNSFLKYNKKNDNEKDYIIYIEEAKEEKTIEMIIWLMDNYNKSFPETQLKIFKEIDELQLESYNFFTNNSSSLISRIWSLLINLTDKYSDVLKYLIKSLCFLETDAMKIFKYLYDNLDENHFEDLIRNLHNISFFCDSDSILWKYKNLIYNFQEKEKDEDNRNNEKYYNYFKSQKIDIDDEILSIKKEINNISKLSIYWDDNKIDNYKGKLLTLQNLLISYKNKDIEDAEITKLRSEASSLLIKLDNKTKNNQSSKKSLNFLKDEITKFTTSVKPTKELFKILQNKTNVFMNLIGRKDENNIDTLLLPNKNDSNIDIDMKHFKLYELIFWYSLIDEGLSKLLDPETDERAFMEISMNLYKDMELDPIITYINEKKLELSGNTENKNLSFKDKQNINQMLRGIFLSKIKSNKIELKDLSNFVHNINSKMYQNEEISDEEYYFTIMISEKYSKNLKIKIPFFEPFDVFYLFYKYDKGKSYKLVDSFNEVCNFGGSNDIAETISKKKMIIMICLKYQMKWAYYFMKIFAMINI